MKRKLLSLLLALTMCIVWLPTLSASAEEGSASRTWSMLLYICGADLEGAGGFGTGTLLDILDNDLPDNLKIAVYTGGSPAWDPKGAGAAFNEKVGYEAYVNPGVYNNLFFIEEDENGLNPRMVEVGKGRTDESSYNPMNEVDTATEFFELVNEADPEFFAADHILLEFWDHGGAWQGAQMDIYSQGIMTVQGIKATADKAAELHGDKIDIIGFHDCLMSSFEVAYWLKDSADYLVASEEVLYNEGWRYNFLSIGEDGCWPEDPTPENLAKVIVDKYITTINRDTPYLFSTLSVVDLSRMEALRDALNEFIVDVAYVLLDDLQQGDIGSYIRIARAAETAQAMHPGHGMIDIYDFMYKVSRINDKLKEAADKFIKVLGAPPGSDSEDYNGHVGEADYIGGVIGENPAVIYRGTSSKFDNSVGLSIFYPLSGIQGNLGLIMNGYLNDIYKYMDLDRTYIEFLNWFVMGSELPLFSGNLKFEYTDKQFNLLIDPEEVDVIKKIEFIITSRETDLETFEDHTYLLGSKQITEGWEDAKFSQPPYEEWYSFNGHPVTMTLDNIAEYPGYQGYDRVDCFYNMPVKADILGVLYDGTVNIRNTFLYEMGTKNPVAKAMYFNSLTTTSTDPETGAAVTSSHAPEGLKIYPALAVFDMDDHEIIGYVPYMDSPMELTSGGKIPLDSMLLTSNGTTNYRSYFRVTDARGKVYLSDTLDYLVIENFDDVSISPIIPQEYTGSAVEPKVRLIYQGNHIFEEGKDYVLEFSNNIEKGTASVTVISLLDDLPGTLTADFRIVDAEEVAEMTVGLLPDHDVGMGCLAVDAFEFVEHTRLLEEAKRCYEYGYPLSEESLAKLNRQYYNMTDVFELDLAADNGAELIGAESATLFEHELVFSAENDGENNWTIGLNYKSINKIVPFVPGETLTVKLPVTGDISGVYYVDENSRHVALSFRQVEGAEENYVIFDTEVLGNFVLTTDDNPNTGFDNMFIVELTGVFAALCAVIIIRKKSYNR